MDPLDALIVDLLHAADGSTQGIDELIRVLGIKLARLRKVGFVQPVSTTAKRRRAGG